MINNDEKIKMEIENFKTVETDRCGEEDHCENIENFKALLDSLKAEYKLIYIDADFAANYPELDHRTTKEIKEFTIMEFSNNDEQTVFLTPQRYNDLKKFECCELLDNDRQKWEKFPIDKLCLRCTDVNDELEEDEIYFQD